MKLKGKKVQRVLVAIMIAALLILSACSGNNAGSGNNPTTTPAPSDSSTPTAKPTPEAPKNPVELTVHGWYISPSMQATMDLFTETYPWITIKHNGTAVSGAFINNIIAGEKTDIVFLDRGLYEWIAGGNDLVEDLTPYIEKDERIQSANIVDGFMESFQTGGKQFTLPFTDIPMWVIVNKDMLEKYGEPMPALDWTYNDMLEIAKRATDKDAGDWGMSAGMIGWMIDTLLIANGHAENARYMSAGNLQSTANTPGALADFQWVQDVIHKWNVHPSAAQIKELGLSGDNGADFVIGNSLFTVAADWNLETLKQATFEWDVLPYPRGTVKQVTNHQVGPMVMTKASKHKEEAFMFMSFLFSEEAQKIMIDNGSGAWVKSPALDNYYKEAAIWAGKNTDVVIMSAEMGTFSADSSVVDLSRYVNSVTGRIGNAIGNNTNLSEVIPFVEEYNTFANDMRPKLGW